jgi:calcium-translocating P-type ATPase
MITVENINTSQDVVTNGLTSKQAEESRATFGSNKLPEKKLKTAWDFFTETFKDRLNQILIGMMLVFTVLAFSGQGSFSEPLGIFVVLLAIAVISTRTGLKSQKSTKELKDKTSVHYCNVLRDGEIKHINTDEIVVGDVVHIESGEAIYADGYLVEGKISVDNSVLNGESKECKKSVIPDFIYTKKTTITGDDYVDTNSLFAGATVVDGEGKMIVTEVGVNTVNGKTITSMNEIEETKTSLEIQLDDLAGAISKFGTIGALFIAVASLISNVMIVGGLNEFLQLGWLPILSKILTIVTTALTIVVAAVPEGLPLIISLITSQNAKRMLDHNVLAKHTNKIPEAGNIQLLCTDKTGTLTKGILQPVHNITLDGVEIDDSLNGIKHLFLENVCLNSTAMFDSEGKIVGGNATERALLSMVDEKTYKQYVNANITNRKSFNSAYKYSAVEVEHNMTYYKGAPEKLLGVAKKYMNSTGDVVDIDINDVKNKISSFTTKAMRVIATGVSQSPLGEDLPEDMVIVSLVAIRDDVREEVPEAVKKMHGAGVQVMMVTGDVIETAVAIAEDAGLLTEKTDIAMSAIDFDKLSDDEAKEKLPHIKVIARATPQTKLRIVKLAQELGLCVGMTGDGTNDSPALKAADVGFSMGSGTDVCKEAGDIIITDDNFVSITDAVMLGRTFMHNVMKFLKFQLPINISLVLLSVIYSLFMGMEAIAAVQILIINIVMDSLNSLSFGGEPPKSEYMREQPIPKGSKLLSKETMIQIGVSVVTFMAIFGITAIPAVRNLFGSEEVYATARFAMLVIMATINGFNIRTDSMNLFKGIKSNTMFVKIALTIFAGVILLCSFGGTMLHCAPLNLTQWVVIFALSLIVVPVDLIRKKIMNGGVK